MTLRERLYHELDPAARAGEWPSRLNQFVLWLILLAVVVVTLGTEPLIAERWGGWLLILDLILAVAFSIEYVLRVWVAGENPKYSGVSGRLRYMVSPAALIDLIAVVPYWVALAGSESFLLRVVRLLRIVAVVKVGRYSKAFGDITRAIHERRHMLVVAMVSAFGMVFFSATALYLIEGAHSPEHFGSIPRAMWWSVTTLTTVGYGDVIPLTVLGKVFGALTSLGAIFMLALPTSILAGAFADVFRSGR